MSLIKIKYSGPHRGANGKVYRFVAGKTVEVSDTDLKGLDKKDYEVVESAKKGKEKD